MYAATWVSRDHFLCRRANCVGFLYSSLSMNFDPYWFSHTIVAAATQLIISTSDWPQNWTPMRSMFVLVAYSCTGNSSPTKSNCHGTAKPLNNYQSCSNGLSMMNCAWTIYEFFLAITVVSMPTAELFWQTANQTVYTVIHSTCAAFSVWINHTTIRTSLSLPFGKSSCCKLLWYAELALGESPW